MRVRTFHAEVHEQTAAPDIASMRASKHNGHDDHSDTTPHQNATIAAPATETPPVSTTMKCVSSLLVQFFVVYAGLAVSRTITMFTGGVMGSAAAEEIFNGAKETVNLAPPIGVLFVATRMRALQLSDDDPDTYDLPQSWCQSAMVACTLSVTWGTVMYFMSALSMPKLPTEGTQVGEQVAS